VEVPPPARVGRLKVGTSVFSAEKTPGRPVRPISLALITSMGVGLSVTVSGRPRDPVTTISLAGFSLSAAARAGAATLGADGGASDVWLGAMLRLARWTGDAAGGLLSRDAGACSTLSATTPSRAMAMCSGVPWSSFSSAARGAIRPDTPRVLSPFTLS
jgi:hypothetical protein